MDAITLALPLLITLILVAVAFDFLNGLHDAANSIATIVSTRVLKPRYAVAWAAFFNFAAVLVFGALMGAIAWNIITWLLGIPSSSSHALVGGLLGAGIAKVGFSAIVWPGVI